MRTQLPIIGTLPALFTGTQTTNADQLARLMEKHGTVDYDQRKNWPSAFDLYEKGWDHDGYDGLIFITIPVRFITWKIMCRVNYTLTITLEDPSEGYMGSYGYDVKVTHIDVLKVRPEGVRYGELIEANARFIGALEGLIQKMVA